MPTLDAALTHREFVRALNQSCSRGRPAANRHERRFDAAIERGDLPAAGRVYAAQLRLLKQHTRRVEDLEPPSEDRKAFRRYMSAQRRIQGLGDRMVRALKDSDVQEVVRLNELFQRERDRRLTAALDMGADKCGS